MNTAPELHPASTAAAPARTPPGRRVVDAPTRMFHWLFALSFLGAYLSADGERWRALHVSLGYTMAGLLAFRLLYGVFGPRHAGLGPLWRKVTGGPTWLRSVLRDPTAIAWRQGQNLLMALAVLVLIALVLPLTLSGYATYNDWGDAFEELHEFFGNAMLAVVLGHLALVTGLSLLRQKNQALPMITGRTEGSGPDLVKHNRGWLAVLLLAAVLGYLAWEWQQAPNGLVPTSSWSGMPAGREGHDDDD